jgi:hypothetical protein
MRGFASQKIRLSTPRTIAYVLTGENSSVLLQLEQQAKEVQSALSQYPHAGMAAATQAEVQAAIKARNNVLLRQYGPEATWIRRYLEVLTLSHKGSRWGIFSHQGPSPFWLRGFFAQGEPRPSPRSSGPCSWSGIHKKGQNVHDRQTAARHRSRRQRFL